ncbi:MAG: phytanoyl-CoA dioxygenase family protein [Saprospirales bacterium]|nr:phytanoyl-CoA dioxygenase family protein [Saprospirales bacterium]MBK8920529.1 phytanoyl-CoA dioxygenase family protein [Saprospirales bacterium]
MLQRLFQKYTGFLRSLKAVYVLNNLLNIRFLRRNRRLYQRYGIKKSILSPVGSADFQQHHTDIPWLDRPDACEQLERRPAFLAMPPAMQAKVRQFVTDGYFILEGFYSQAQTDALHAEVDRLLEAGRAGFNYTGRKIFNLQEQSRLADEQFFRHPHILKMLSFLLGKPVIPFQSLSFIQGSEQRAHSDSIHMTTEPPGYLIATWTALEDCLPDSGALFYYPGSHRLPYITSADYASGNTRFTIGENSNRQYEDKVEAVLREHPELEKKVFLAQRGDVLVWHANLVHGGGPITRPGATRRSFVCHYFAEEVICYHEMSQRPALIKKAAGT